MGPGRNSLEETEREKLGKFYSELKERRGCNTGGASLNKTSKLNSSWNVGLAWNNVKKFNAIPGPGERKKIKSCHPFQKVDDASTDFISIYLKYLNLRPISGAVNRH